MKVVIMRGISGAGKSTWVQKNVEHPKSVKSFGEFMTKVHAFRLPDITLVVDLCNLHLHNLTPYLLVAQYDNLDVRLVTIICDPNIAARRTGKSRAVLEAQAEQLRTAIVPEEWELPEEVVYDDGRSSIDAQAEYMLWQENFDKARVELRKRKPSVDRLRGILGVTV